MSASKQQHHRQSEFKNNDFVNKSRSFDADQLRKRRDRDTLLDNRRNRQLANAQSVDGSVSAAKERIGDKTDAELAAEIQELNRQYDEKEMHADAQKMQIFLKHWLDYFSYRSDLGYSCGVLRMFFDRISNPTTVVRALSHENGQIRGLALLVLLKLSHILRRKEDFGMIRVLVDLDLAAALFRLDGANLTAMDVLQNMIYLAGPHFRNAIVAAPYSILDRLAKWMSVSRKPAESVCIAGMLRNLGYHPFEKSEGVLLHKIQTMVSALIKEQFMDEKIAHMMSPTASSALMTNDIDDRYSIVASALEATVTIYETLRHTKGWEKMSEIWLKHVSVIPNLHTGLVAILRLQVPADDQAITLLSRQDIAKMTETTESVWSCVRVLCDLTDPGTEAHISAFINSGILPVVEQYLKMFWKLEGNDRFNKYRGTVMHAVTTLCASERIDHIHMLLSRGWLGFMFKLVSTDDLEEEKTIHVVNACWAILRLLKRLYVVQDATSTNANALPDAGANNGGQRKRWYWVLASNEGKRLLWREPCDDPQSAYYIKNVVVDLMFEVMLELADNYLELEVWQTLASWITNGSPSSAAVVEFLESKTNVSDSMVPHVDHARENDEDDQATLATDLVIRLFDTYFRKYVDQDEQDIVPDEMSDSAPLTF